MKIKHLLLAFLIVPFLISNRADHDYYVSVTEVEYSEKTKSIQIISQIFIDDFETLLRKRFDETIVLDTKNESEQIETYMQRYLSDKFKVKVNGEPVNFKFIGKEYKDDITYCYLEVEEVSDMKSIAITNKILFDAFEGQQNILRLKLLNRNKSFLMVPENDSCLLNFK